MFQNLIDQASTFLEKELPFVLYSKPNSATLNAIFQTTNEVHRVKDFTETGFVFAPFDGTSRAVLFPADQVLIAPIDLEALPVAPSGSTMTVNESGRDQYLKLITKALEKINSGTIEKVVLSRKIEVNCKLAPLVVLKQILKTYPTAFCYLWHHPKVGMWVGATPEILIKSKGLEFTTMSLAGTQSTLEFTKPQWTKKEINEQQLVTDYIQEALKKVEVSVERSETETIRAGHLWHLRTQLRGTFAPNSFGTVLKAIHPTPAVCGIPLEETKNFIRQNEAYDRTFYTGFLGELNFKSDVQRNRNPKNQENSAYRNVVKKSELFVNLRCMQLHKGKADVYVGGGITRESNPENEWDETVSKSVTMLRILNYK